MLESYKGTAKVLWIIQMVEYSKVNVKLPDRQLKNLKTTVKNKTGVTLRISLKMEMICLVSYYWQQDKKRS